MTSITITREHTRAEAKALAGNYTAAELRERAAANPDDATILNALAEGLERLGWMTVTDLADYEIDEILACV